MAERNAGVPQARRIEYRIGINLDDVIHDQKSSATASTSPRGSNPAEPGGIYTSRSVRDRVSKRLGFTFEDKGEQALKSNAAPVHAYRVRFPGPDPKQPAASAPTRRRNLVLTTGAGLAAIVDRCAGGGHLVDPPALGRSAAVSSRGTRAISAAPTSPEGREPRSGRVRGSSYGRVELRICTRPERPDHHNPG
jgi:hypothetical protein